MPYLLLGLAIIIFLNGITRLRGGAPHPTPWRAPFVWAVLFGAGVVVWTISTAR